MALNQEINRDNGINARTDIYNFDVNSKEHRRATQDPPVSTFVELSGINNVDDPPPYMASSATPDASRRSLINLSTTEDVPGPPFERLQNVHATSPRQHQLFISKDGPFYAMLKDAVDMREKVVGKRVGMDIQANNYNAQWKHTSDHLSNFMKAATDFMMSLPASGDTTSVPLQQSLKKNWKKLQQSASHLENWQAQGQSSVRQLTKWEGALLVKEEKLYQRFKQIILEPDVSDLTSIGSGVTLEHDRLSDSSMSSNESDPAEHDYYEKVGDLQLLREQIFNMDGDQRKREVRREHAIRTGEFNARHLDSHSYEVFIATRHARVSEYLETKQEMGRLREVCRTKGIVVEEPDAEAFLDLSRPTEEQSHSRMHRRIDWPQRWDLDKSLVSSGLDQRNRVIVWRDAVRRSTGFEREQSRSSSRAPTVSEKAISSTSSPPPRTYPYPAGPPPPQPEATPPPIEVPGINDGENSVIDENQFRFGDIQDELPPSRRYSEPTLRGLPLEILSGKDCQIARERPKSESGLDLLTSVMGGKFQSRQPTTVLSGSEHQYLFMEVPQQDSSK